MEKEYYPWGGDFTTCDSESTVAVVLLSIDYTPPSTVAIYGSLKTENIGIEKIIANVISNPQIRYLLVCGKDIRGHKSGASLLSLHQHGIDGQHRIKNAPGAIPYIENLSEEAIQRFQQQITVIDLIDVVDIDHITQQIEECLRKKTCSFGDPYIAVRFQQEPTQMLNDKRAIHSHIIVDYRGKIKKRGE